MKTLISVITVCLNAEKDIEFTMDSVLDQDFTEYEYLIQDGGSDDRTIEIAEGYRERFKERNIPFRIISEKDEGLYDAMNKAFFSLSIGIGAMAIFGSYVGKERSILGESLNVIFLDTFVAILAGIIIFPACFTFDIEVNAGPSLLFDTMANVFNNMKGGRIWGSLFFLFMVFAAFSTELGVFEGILASVRELTGWKRPVGCGVCAVVIALLSSTTALGYSVLHFQPFAEGSAWLDFWDFIVSTNLLPLGAFVFSVFCCYKFGWGWDEFVAEANSGKGLKIQSWMKLIFKYLVPILTLGLYVYGLITFDWG
ncbi:MAG: sodium-dependent transporter [Lachnospiraceae bacterium]|nr:sodium-dependent transporter [Lachnospiraceae bacterium]